MCWCCSLLRNSLLRTVSPLILCCFSLRSPQLARMKLAFEKKRTEPKPGVPGKPYYSVRIAKKGKGAAGGQRGIRGTMKGLGRQPKKGVRGGPMSRTTGSSTFMTQGARVGGGRFGNTTGSIARGSGRSAVAARSKPSTLQERRAQAKVSGSESQRVDAFIRRISVINSKCNF